MNPTRSAKKSRRSSILKPPKPRQPLQNVELAVSSAENSPATTTGKIKRRVSFAEKKHVKEFCDSMEQGTVWDNTYEESELSQIKNNQNSNNDENIISNENVNQLTKIQSEIYTKSIRKLEINDSNLIQDETRISIVTESAVSITESVNTENIKIYVDEDFSTVERNFDMGHSMGGLVHTKPSDVSFPPNYSSSFNVRRSLSVTENVFGRSTKKEKSLIVESADSYPSEAFSTTDATEFRKSTNFLPPTMRDDDCNEVPMDETLIEDSSTEPTVPTHLTPSKDRPLLRSSFNVIPNIDFLRNDSISNHLPLEKVSSKSKENFRSNDPENCRDTIDPMESNEGQNCPKDQSKITVYQDTSMDMTETVSGRMSGSNRMSIISKRKPNKSEDKESNEESSLVTEEKTIFQMKTLETVPKILALSSAGIKEFNENEINLRPDRMPIFHNKSMELGEIVQNVSRTEQLQKLPPARTTIFRNESVEFTEIVENNRNTEKPEERGSEGTTIFHDKSLELTETVHQLQKQESERMTIFHNESVDMTEVVRSSSSNKSEQKLPSEKTTIFHDQSVDVTETVRSRSTYEKPHPEKITVFQNQSMDMTETVRSRSTYEKPPPEKTMVFQNQSVDMTEIVQSRLIHENPQQPPPEKTTVFQNQSMDMTEAVRSRSTYEKPPPVKTTVFQNQSMGMTEAVRSRSIYAKPPPEKTTIFQNQSVDMTEVVQSRLIHENPQQSPPEKTTVFQNQSMDMTEAVRSRSTYEKPPPVKTTVFQNQSMDMTEAVRSRSTYEKPPPEKTTIFQNQSVDMTEVIQSSSNDENPQKPPPEKTTIFQNQSVDMTEVIQSSSRYENVQKPLQEKATIFKNQSMDTTEVVRSNRAIDKSQIHENMEIFNEKSVDPIEIIPSGLSIENPIQQIHRHEVLPSNSERTSVSHDTPLSLINLAIEKENEEFENQSEKLTETMPQVPSALTLLSRDSCTLAVERMAKRQPLDFEEANRLIASIEVKNSDPEVRSPVSKRMKSLGSRKSIDVTAAVPFVVYRKLARQQRDEIKSPNLKTPFAEVDSGTSSKTEVFGNKSMEFTEVAVSSSNIYPSKKFPEDPTETAQQNAQEKVTNLQNKSMEMTEAIPCFYQFESTSQKLPGSTDDDDCQRPQDDTICRDDSMEITRVIPGILKANATIRHDESIKIARAMNPITQIRAVTNENPDRVVKRRLNTLPASESETLVFRDDLMELTNAVQFSKQSMERKERQNPSSNDIRELEKDGKTMIYHDDSMELTRAVPFPSKLQTNASDKENCPLVMESLQARSSRISEIKDNIGVSKNEWLEIMKSVPFLSSQENKENRAELIETEERSNNIGSDEITGVVPFAMQIENEYGDERDLESVGNVTGYGIEKLEMPDGIRWSLDPNVKKLENICHLTDQQPQLSEMETFLPDKKTLQHQSHVAKELFQKPISNEINKTVNEKPTDISGTPDLDAEIKKLAESFALSNSVDESGFDQATFLRQQARCMEDYEANSTASQEYHSGTSYARKNVSFVENRDSVKSTSPKDSVGNMETALPPANLVISSNSKIANTSVGKKGNSIAENNCSLRMDRGRYDRSLEELRCRAYSVSKFKPEETGFELTAGISMTDHGNPRESIFAQEPPSFIFVDSITADSVTDRDASLNVLPTESSSTVGGEKIQARKFLETDRVSVHDFTEIKESLRNDETKVEEIMDIVKVTRYPLDADANEDGNDLKNVNTVERPLTNRSSQTFVIKRPNIDPTIVILSSSETDKVTKDLRVSGVTTAAEFSSESPDGPNEKIRRRENELIEEKAALSIVDKEGNATEFIETDRSWGNRNFASSTVIGDDFTRQFIHQDLEETSIVLKNTLINEMPSVIEEIDDQTVNLLTEVKEDKEITIELEISVPKSPFVVLKETIEILAESAETIWRIKCLDERIVAFNFFSRSIVLAIYLNENANSVDPIKKIELLSQLVEERADPGVRLAHSLIMKKLKTTNLTLSYRTFEDVPRLLEYVSMEVKLGMDFMFELDRLRDRTVMEINGNRIKFMVRTRDINAGIILNITVEIKQFEDISCNDITVSYILGREKVRENDIKRLITNVKRDHRFLRFYINDVKDYIDLMAETGFFRKIEEQLN